MIDTSRRLTFTTAAGLLLHDVRLATADELDDFDRQRLFGAEPSSPTLARCRCGWTRKADDLITVAGIHLQRDPGLPVHHVGGHSAIGSRSRNADSYGSAVDDTTGIAAFAVADGIGNQPDAAKAAAVAVTTALPAALEAPDNPAVVGMLAARDALQCHDLVYDGDTVMVLAVSRPAVPGRGITWDLAWTGDCEGWLLDDNELTPLTFPHTKGQALRESGYPESVAARHDNVVLTTVGTADPATLGTSTVTTDRGRLALTSDGVGKALTHSELHETLSEITDPRECAEFLVGFGVDRPRADNATALVIDTHRR